MVDLNSNYMSASSLHDLVNGLEKAKEINLKNNRIADMGAEALAKKVLEFDEKRLEVLNLENNNLSDNAC